MKNILTIITFSILLMSCSSVKKSTSSLLSGNYDSAIRTSIDKLRKNPSTKKRDSHIELLEEAFAKAVQKDNDRISFLKTAGESQGVEEIYILYKNLDARQERIKPLLPLRLENEGRDAQFEIKNYTNNILSYKTELVNLLYDETTTALADARSKLDYRNAYTDLKSLNSLSPNYKNVTSLLEEAHYKGTDFIEVKLFNDSNIALPRQLENDLLDFSTYDVNEFWKVYHSSPQDGVRYDYAMDVSLREINISPERIQERQLVKEKTIKDGTEFLKDRKGNFKLDEDGNKIEVDKFIDVRSNYFEVLQSKAVNIVGQVRYNNKNNGQLVEAFPLASEFVFEHYYATYDGDRRALDDISYGYTRNRVIPFPTNEQMVFDVGEDLKQRLKSIIVNSNL